jgi:hypothetical protein
MTDFRMGLHTDQQSLILSELSTARTKLEEDNQRIRDELEDARMMIRLLQMKLEYQQKSTIKVKAVGSSDSTVKGGLPGGYWKAMDWAAKTGGSTRKGLFFNRKKHQPTKKEAFNNPTAPGRKTFRSKSTNTKETIKETVKEDTIPYVIDTIEFPTPKTEKPVRSRGLSPKPRRSKQKSESRRVTSSAQKKSVMVSHLQREIFLMAASSATDYKKIPKDPKEKQEEPVCQDPLKSQEEPDQGVGNLFDEAEQALQYSIMDQLEEADIPEGDEVEEEDEKELTSSVMDQISMTVIEEDSHSATSSDLYTD